MIQAFCSRRRFIVTQPQSAARDILQILETNGKFVKGLKLLENLTKAVSTSDIGDILFKVPNLECLSITFASSTIGWTIPGNFILSKVYKLELESGKQEMFQWESLLRKIPNVTSLSFKEIYENSMPIEHLESYWQESGNHVKIKQLTLIFKSHFVNLKKLLPFAINGMQLTTLKITIHHGNLSHLLDLLYALKESLLNLQIVLLTSLNTSVQWPTLPTVYNLMFELNDCHCCNLTFAILLENVPQLNSLELKFNYSSSLVKFICINRKFICGSLHKLSIKLNGMEEKQVVLKPENISKLHRMFPNVTSLALYPLVMSQMRYFPLVSIWQDVVNFELEFKYLAQQFRDLDTIVTGVYSENERISLLTKIGKSNLTLDELNIKIWEGSPFIHLKKLKSLKIIASDSKTSISDISIHLVFGRLPSLTRLEIVTSRSEISNACKKMYPQINFVETH